MIAPPAAADLAALIAPWAIRWGMPGLEHGIAVRFSARLRRTLGRCRPARGEIVLHEALRHDRERLAAVLCHEAAHVAAHHLSGGAWRAHGPEWADLVRRAGYEPTIRAPLGAGVRPARAPRHEPRLRFAHLCPVCQTVRWARRPVARWRCAECVDAGLDGALVIERRAGR